MRKTGSEFRLRHFPPGCILTSDIPTAFPAGKDEIQFCWNTVVDESMEDLY